MPRAIALHRWFGRVLLLLAVASLAPAAAARAQAGAVSGVVRDSLTGLPVNDALIRAEGTGLSSRTNPRGQFTLAGLTGATVNLTVTHLGYEPHTQTASVGATNVSIQIGRSVLR